MPKLDPLTGLLDGSNLEHRLEGLMDRADATSVPLSLLIADLGGLRLINQQFGREAGDVVLKAVADTIGGLMPEAGLSYRLGGDAFVAVLPGSTSADAASLADDLQGAIERTRVALGETIIPLKAFTGIATYPGDAETPRALVRAADRRMHASRAPGLASPD